MRKTKAQKQARAVWVEMLLDAISSGRVWEVRNMLKDGDSPNLVYCFADMARAMLGEEDFELMANANGAQQNHDAVFSTTPLIAALMSRQKLEMLRCLMDAGADPNLANDNGATPLMFSQTLAATRFLVKNGADPHARDNNGWTALIHSPKAAITKYLLELGADVNIVGKDGMTALIRSQSPEITELLLNAGADPNARTADGATALMFAHDMRQIELLLAAGADATCVDEDGMTPLHYAAILNHHRVIPFWAEHFDVNVKDKDGRTPSDMALRHGSLKSSHLLLKRGGMPALAGDLLEAGDLDSLLQSLEEENPYSRH